MAGRDGPPRHGRGSAAGSDAGLPLGLEIHRRIAEEVLRRIAVSPGGHLVNGRAGDLQLTLRVDLRDPEAGAEALAVDLAASLGDYVDELVQEAAAFRPGRAFCHRCESAECEHAGPPGWRDVFAGYGPTGLPRWVEFGQLCLDHRHPRIDRYYDERRPEVLTLRLGGPDLKADLLPEFRRSARRHDLAGQVCAGLFRVPGLAGGEGGVALCFQAVVTRRPGGARRAGLNVIGGGEALAMAPPEGKPWRAAVTWAQARLEEISRRSAAGKMPDAVFERRVESVLGGIVRRIEHDLRGRGRRTRHAEERHLSGARPTRKAMADLRRAGEEEVLVDARHGTVVVLGERGRTHFFTPEGLLVSSVHYPRETILRKLRAGQWRPATAAQAESLRARVEPSTLPEEKGKDR